MTELNNDTEVLQARIERLEAREQQRAKRTRRFIAVGIVSAVAMPFAVRALGAVPHVFSSGETIVASEINENFAHVVGGVTAVETELAARPTGLYCGSTFSNGQFRSGALRGLAAARDLCRTECSGSATAHMCTVSEAAISFQFGLLPADTAGWVTGEGALAGTPTGVVGNLTSCFGDGPWTRPDSVDGTTWNTSLGGMGVRAGVCSMVRPIFCCE